VADTGHPLLIQGTDHRQVLAPVDGGRLRLTGTASTRRSPRADQP
jgi:hypothetical protein